MALLWRKKFIFLQANSSKILDERGGGGGGGGFLVTWTGSNGVGRESASV